MAEDKQVFVGRTHSLGWLRRHLLGWGEDQANTPLILLHGAEGVGKTALVEHFLRTYTGAKGSLKTANFTWKGTVRPTSLVLFARMLLASGTTGVADLEGRRERLEFDFYEPEGHPATTSRRGGDTYTIHGSARDADHGPASLGYEMESGLAETAVRSLVDWLDGGEVLERLNLNNLFRLVFFFDGFDAYPTAIKTWIGRHFFPTLTAERELPRSAFILTGRQSWQDGGQGDYWEAHPGAFAQHYLGPLSRQDCEQWLNGAGRNVSLVDVLYEETEGYPARIEEALREKDWLEKRMEKPADPDDPLSYFTAQQRRWLHAAAMNRAVSLETLQVLLGRVEGTQAFGWLSRHIELCQVERDFRGEHLLVLSDEMRDVILFRIPSRVPARHREFLEKVRLMSSVRAKVDSGEHRGNLRVLTPIQPFNKQLIEEVFRNYA